MMFLMRGARWVGPTRWYGVFSCTYIGDVGVLAEAIVSGDLALPEVSHWTGVGRREATVQSHFAAWIVVVCWGAWWIHLE